MPYFTKDSYHLGTQDKKKRTLPSDLGSFKVRTKLSAHYFFLRWTSTRLKGLYGWLLDSFVFFFERCGCGYDDNRVVVYVVIFYWFFLMSFWFLYRNSFFQKKIATKWNLVKKLEDAGWGFYGGGENRAKRLVVTGLEEIVEQGEWWSDEVVCLKMQGSGGAYFWLGLGKLGVGRGHRGTVLQAYTWRGSWV